MSVSLEYRSPSLLPPTLTLLPLALRCTHSQPASEFAHPAPLTRVPYLTTHQHPILDAKRADNNMISLPHPARPGPSPAHPSNHPPAPARRHLVARFAAAGRAPRLSRVHAQLTLSSSTARARGPSLRDGLAPRAHALTRASCPALLQILFSPALWAGADRVTPPCAWPPPGGFLALILA